MYQFRFLLYGATLLAFEAPAKAADIIKRSGDGLQMISIEGPIEPYDYEKFRSVANRLTRSRAVIFLQSSGGSLIDAMQIGEFIRLKGWATATLGRCMSSCAVIWIAGTRRITSPKHQIGFHAASVDGVEKGAGNAMLDAYLSRLGLSYGAIAWATEAGPNEISYLTPTKAKELGIDVETVEESKQATSTTKPTAPLSDADVGLSPECSRVACDGKTGRPLQPQSPRPDGPIQWGATPIKPLVPGGPYARPAVEPQLALSPKSKKESAPTVATAMVHFPPKASTNLHLRRTPDPQGLDVLAPDEFFETRVRLPTPVDTLVIEGTASPTFPTRGKK
jgi:ATP-dependent protease ClpP protease subunit